MGEIAEMMLDGTLDANTGEYIGPGYGIPRTIDKSLPWERKATSGKNWTITKRNQLNGIIRWLENKTTKLRIPKNTSDWTGHQYIIHRYATEVLKMEHRQKYDKYAGRIQEDFPSFCNWVYREFGRS